MHDMYIFFITAVKTLLELDWLVMNCWKNPSYRGWTDKEYIKIYSKMGISKDTYIRITQRKASFILRNKLGVQQECDFWYYQNVTLMLDLQTDMLPLFSIIKYVIIIFTLVKWNYKYI